VSRSLRALSTALLDGEEPVDAPMAPRFVVESPLPSVHFVSSFANVAAFETDDGLALIDTGSFLLAEPTRVLLRQSTRMPAKAAVFTHGHVDHCFGVELYEAEPDGGRVHVVAHRNVSRRFERYRLTSGYNARINGRQFQVEGQFPTTFREPDTEYDDHATVEVGGRTFELFHALGETDDHTWVWVPDQRVLCTGDLFIWASPNCGNPQKAQRYPREWAAALRRMSALEPELLLPGHGLPIWGAGAIRLALEETATLLESLVAQTLEQMNAGATLDQVLATVRAPEHLLHRPYLQPVYDEPEFVVRNLWRLYGGWWDGDPASLKPARRADLGGELARLSGGVGALVSRAEALLANADLALASHLVETALAAAPDDPTVHASRKRIYEARATAERSLMARGVFTAAAAESEAFLLERGEST
jgi:glyoxylase-like metal-dependent hydrolase (beta-lactamase superfamily II)